MLDINLKQLETFVTVAELNHFTRAADQLFLTQPTVSAHIRGLEEALGVTLFDRGSKRSVTLNPEAEHIYRCAKDILLLCQELEGHIAEEEQPLTIGSSTVPANYILPRLMREFLDKYPSCSYVLKLGDSTDIHRQLTKGEVSIGFVGATQDSRHFRYYPLIEDTLVLVTQNNDYYRDLQEKGLTGRDLLSEPMVAREEGSGTQQAVQTYLQENGVDPKSMFVVAQMDTVESIKQSVIQGLGVAIISEIAVLDGVASGQLLQFPLTGQGAKRMLYVARMKCRKLTDMEKAFLHYIQREFMV